MNSEPELPQMLRDATTDAVVSPPPIDSIVRNGARARRRRTAAVVATAGAVTLALLTVVSGIAPLLQAAGRPGVATTPGEVGDARTKATAPSPTADGGTSEDKGGKYDTPVPVTLGEEVDGQARFDAATPLSECPELLEFLMSPEVVELQREFGEPFTPDTRFGGGCPDLGLMKERFEAARELLAQ